MKRSGCSDPWATAMKAPMPSLATSAGPWILQLMPGSLARARAASASKVGVAWLAGRLAHSRARVMPSAWATAVRSEEHTSELQSQSNLVCRLLLEKKKKKKNDKVHLSRTTTRAESWT